MKLLLLSVGKIKDKRLAGLVEDYLKRLRGFTRIEWRVIKPAELASSRDNALQVEGARILARITADDVVVLLNEKGMQWKSEELAHWLDKQQRLGRQIVFVVGGPWGTSAEVWRRADVHLSLSPFTLQHDLALLVLVEQLYRGFTILAGHPYHK